MLPLYAAAFTAAFGAHAVAACLGVTAALVAAGALPGAGGAPAAAGPGPRREG